MLKGGMTAPYVDILISCCCFATLRADKGSVKVAKELANAGFYHRESSVACESVF
jgi:hypothetical protein